MKLSEWLNDFDKTDHDALIVAIDRVVIPEIVQLEAENERPKEAWAALCERMFDGWEMPLDFFLDKGEECGLLVKEIYDPEGKHKDINVDEVIPGDECYFNVYALGGDG